MEHSFSHDGIVEVRGSPPVGSTKFFLPEIGSEYAFPLNSQDQHSLT